MKKVLFGLFVFFLGIASINANTISNISMDIYIDSNGNASVTEIWTSDVENGTEGWHPYYNIGNASISDLKVSMDGKAYITIDNWNINASFNDKAYKAGFYYPNNNEIDICFGITSYGKHTYNIKYKINGFVARLNDADMVYWQLFPYDFSAEPEKVYIKIYSDYKYSDNLDVWGYGNYGGTAYVYDGYIEMQSNGRLKSHEYMTILVKFPKDTFATTNVIARNFEEYFNKAQDGATSYNDESGFNFESFMRIITFVVSTGVMGTIIYMAFRTTDYYRFGSTGNRVRKDVPNFRDIPCNKDIFRAYFVTSKYSLLRKKEDFLGAVLLKWLKNDNVRVEKVEIKKLFRKETLDNIIFINKPTDITVETTLYDWMVEASKDGKLEANEFKKWCDKNYSSILGWFDKVVLYERDALILENKIKEVKEKKVFTKTYYEVDPSMMIEAEQMLGLKKFLKEFTLIKEREPIEVKLWDEYLIYAQIFGIAKEVMEQFKKLYPDVIESINSSGFSFNDMLFLSNISRIGVVSASTAKERARSYNAGGGGFSSGGGGGGSFGGGGGGGFR